MQTNINRCCLFIVCLVLYSQWALAQAQNPFLGGVPNGQPSATVLDLTLSDAVDRALKYNLGIIEGSQNTRAAQATRLRNLNALLPNLATRLSASPQQINLKSLGFNLNLPGIHVPSVVGPFVVEDARAYISQTVFNWTDIKNWKAATESERAAQFTYKRDREVVVLTAGNAYLLVISDIATVDSIRARVTTAQTLYQNDLDQNRQGVIASIDVLRAQVELQTEQQRLIAAGNQLSIDKLTLGRIIGLPGGQDFRLADTVPYSPLAGITLEESLEQARATRADYRSAEAQVRAAELTRHAAGAENYPSLATDANYGFIGNPNFASSHGSFAFAVGVNIPIFQGTRVQADKLQANAAFQQRLAELMDLEGRIDNEVRTAFFNLQSSSELVTVAKSNMDLATQTQAQDRFRAGVADNLEVVQAQESVATANQSYIASLYSYNLSKLSLALALGVAEQSTLQYLGVK